MRPYQMKNGDHIDLDSITHISAIKEWGGMYNIGLEFTITTNMTNIVIKEEQSRNCYIEKEPIKNQFHGVYNDLVAKWSNVNR